MNKNQRNILIMAGMVLGAILVVLFFIYLPKNREMKKLKTEFLLVKKDLDNIQRITGNAGDIDILITKYAEKIKEYETMLPRREEQTLRTLAKAAADLDIKVLSITPQTAILTELPITIEGCNCKELKIAIELVTSYRKLGEYFSVLQYKFPTLIRLDSLKLKKQDEYAGLSVLSVSLDVTLFMLVPE